MFGRITQRPDTMGGRACIRGMRVTVGMIGAQVVAALRAMDAELAAGALMTIDPCRT